MNALRVALLMSVPVPPREGIGFYVFNLARELQRLGHLPTVLTRGSARSTRTGIVDGIPVVELPFVPAYPVHVHLHALPVNRWLRDHEADFDVVHANTPLVPAVRVRTPLVTTVHSRLADDARRTDVDDLRSLLVRLQTPVSARLERGLLARSDSVAVVDGGIATDVERDVRGRVPVVVRPNGVDVTTFCPLDTGRSTSEVLAVGRLVGGKGWEDLLAAWPVVVRAHPGGRLAIVGEGPLEGRLRDLATDPRVAASVEFVGAIGLDRRDELVARYQRAAVVVQPSHHEGMSTVLLEAMACATPVVATAVGAHPTLVRDGQNGRLVPARAPDAIAAAVSDLLAHPETAAWMGRRGRDTVVAAHGWPGIARAYADLYSDIAAGHRRAH